MTFPKYKIAVSMALVSMMLTAFVLVPPVVAEGQTSSAGTFQNVTADTAYNMITSGDSPNLLILDVRNQSEYDLGHLYGAVLVPYYQLETRIGELEDYLETEMIVYCKSGGRSQLACEVLVDQGFTKVYNMLGGITSWIEAGYPIFTTFHHVTVNTVCRWVHLEIEPLLLLQKGCTSCGENQGCPSDGEITNITLTVLEQEEDYTVTLVTFEVNGTTFEVTVTRSLLWSYNERTYLANRTASFVLTEIATEDASVQFYTLSYFVQHVDYNLTLYTSLAPLDSETYNSSFTIMNYAPAGKSEVESLELVEFISSVTLSQLYASLGMVAWKMGNIYLKAGVKNGDATLVQLAWNYYKMATETIRLSWLVKSQLQEYDLRILYNLAILMDDWGSCVAECILHIVDIMHLSGLLEICWGSCYLCIVPPHISCVVCLACMGAPVAGCATYCTILCAIWGC